jgi:hypothetical protein
METSIESIESLKTGRRSFLGAISGLIAPGIAAVMSVMIGRYAIAPALAGASEEEWIEVGPPFKKRRLVGRCC